MISGPGTNPQAGCLLSRPFVQRVSFNSQAEEAGGKIAAVDPSAGTIVLEDGTTFTIAEGVSMEGLQPGTEVKVSFEEQDGQLIASEVVPSN